MTSPFDARPIIVAIAGPNGAGKSTFHAAHLAPAALRFVNADDLARELGVDALEGARLASRDVPLFFAEAAEVDLVEVAFALVTPAAFRQEKGNFSSRVSA